MMCYVYFEASQSILGFRVLRGNMATNLNRVIHRVNLGTVIYIFLKMLEENIEEHDRTDKSRLKAPSERGNRSYETHGRKVFQS